MMLLSGWLVKSVYIYLISNIILSFNDCDCDCEIDFITF